MGDMGDVASPAQWAAERLNPRWEISHVDRPRFGLAAGILVGRIVDRRFQVLRFTTGLVSFYVHEPDGRVWGYDSQVPVEGTDEDVVEWLAHVYFRCKGL
jgi:hypothetical protein